MVINKKRGSLAEYIQRELHERYLLGFYFSEDDVQNIIDNWVKIDNNSLTFITSDNREFEDFEKAKKHELIIRIREASTDKECSMLDFVLDYQDEVGEIVKDINEKFRVED